MAPKAKDTTPISKAEIPKFVAYDGKRDTSIPVVEEKRNIDARAVAISLSSPPFSKFSYEGSLASSFPSGSLIISMLREPKEKAINIDKINGEIIENLLINAPPSRGPIIIARPHDMLNFFNASSSLPGAESAIIDSIEGQKAATDIHSKNFIGINIRGLLTRL